MNLHSEKCSKCKIIHNIGLYCEGGCNNFFCNNCYKCFPCGGNELIILMDTFNNGNHLIPYSKGQVKQMKDYFKIKNDYINGCASNSCNECLNNDKRICLNCTNFEK